MARGVEWLVPSEEVLRVGGFPVPTPAPAGSVVRQTTPLSPVSSLFPQDEWEPLSDAPAGSIIRQTTQLAPVASVLPADFKVEWLGEVNPLKNLQAWINAQLIKIGQAPRVTLSGWLEGSGTCEALQELWSKAHLYPTLIEWFRADPTELLFVTSQACTKYNGMKWPPILGTPVDGVPQTYTVKAGEDIFDIAKKFTGLAGKTPELLAANPQKSGAAVSANERLWLPVNWPAVPPLPLLFPQGTPGLETEIGLPPGWELVPGLSPVREPEDISPPPVGEVTFQWGVEDPLIEGLQKELNTLLVASNYSTISVTKKLDAATCGAMQWAGTKLQLPVMETYGQNCRTPYAYPNLREGGPSGEGGAPSGGATVKKSSAGLIAGLLILGVAGAIFYKTVNP